MNICFDVEVKYIGGMPPRGYDDAWEMLRSIDFQVFAATAYFIELETFRSYSADQLGDLCRGIAGATKVVTFNGKLWDVPILSRHATTDDQTEVLKGLCVETAEPSHDDICQIARTLAHGKFFQRHALTVLNFGSQQAAEWDTQADRYQIKLQEEGWPNYTAYKASRAWNDVSTTYALWKLWRTGELRVSA